MPVIVVDSLLSVKNDGLTSLTEAFKAAVAKSLATGEEVTIRFTSAMDIQLAKSLEVPAGARIVIDGMIEGSTTTQIGGNQVALHGDGGGSIPPNDGKAHGFTMVKVAEGGSLILSDVELSSNQVIGADGKSGKSGDDGVNGLSGSGEGVPGSPGNGGLSVATGGKDGKDAVAGILNFGTLVLDRVNMNGLKAYAGDAGDGGSGGDGGDGGNGGAPIPGGTGGGGGGGGGTGIGGPGGPGGSGTGRGGNGGDAVAGVMNYGTLTMMDTYFQSNFVSSGAGGAGGNGGDGGKGGFGSIGGAGGNGGAAGNGGRGGDAAVTVFNQGTMTLQGGWAYDDGANLIWSSSGAGGAGGIGGDGGGGGLGIQPNGNGFGGVGAVDGVAGRTGAGDAAIGWKGTTSDTTYFIAANRSIVNEYKGVAGQAVTLTITRMGDTSAAGSVTLDATGVTLGATGSNLQDGLFSGQVVTFVAGQSFADVFLFVRSDQMQTGDQDYRFTLTGATGGVLGGHVATDLTVQDNDIVGDGGANRLVGRKGAEVISAAAGNDSLIASDGDDRIDGQSGFDTVDYSAVQRGGKGAGLVADMTNFTFSGKGVGVDQVFNVEALIASAFDDRVTGGFNSERYEMGSGDDKVLGGFGNDTVLGQKGNDRLLGGDQSDSLAGGAGQDVITGGTGADRFVFDAFGAGNLDHVTDFKPVDDTLVLVRTGAFEALALGALAKGAFVTAAVATKAGHHILYERATGTLSYDADGVGGAAALAFAVLDNGAKIDATDFLVI